MNKPTKLLYDIIISETNVAMVASSESTTPQQQQQGFSPLRTLLTVFMFPFEVVNGLLDMFRGVIGLVRGLQALILFVVAFGGVFRRIRAF